MLVEVLIGEAGGFRLVLTNDCIARVRGVDLRRG